MGSRIQSWGCVGRCPLTETHIQILDTRKQVSFDSLGIIDGFRFVMAIWIDVDVWIWPFGMCDAVYGLLSKDLRDGDPLTLIWPYAVTTISPPI